MEYLQMNGKHIIIYENITHTMVIFTDYNTGIKLMLDKLLTSMPALTIFPSSLVTT